MEIRESRYDLSSRIKSWHKYFYEKIMKVKYWVIHIENNKNRCQFKDKEYFHDVYWYIIT